MRYGGEGRSEEMVGELVFHQDFSSIFKAIRRLPGVVADGVSFPFDKIPVSSAPCLVVRDRFYFVFFFTFDKVRRWFHKVGAMGLGLAIR